MHGSTFHYHHDFPSKFLRCRRTVIVWLPPGYDPAGGRYPVFYLHDGQNLFDPATSFTGVDWQADEAADRLVRAGEVRPVILVGVYNTPQRLAEYGPKKVSPSRGLHRSRRYGKFLVEELKPFIDRTYHTAPGRLDTAVGGSSMGGLISLHLCQWYPYTFSMCAALSPSLWWDDEAFLKGLARSRNREWLTGARFWIDVGDAEGPPDHAQAHAERTRKLAARLTERGLIEGRDFVHGIAPGGRHHEGDWAARFPMVLKFFFGRG